MEQAKKHLAILNLTGEFPPELLDYFISRGILVVDPLSCKESYDWTHIITKDVHDFTLINKTYQVTAKEISIISLTKVDDLQNFVLNNGNIVIDEGWFKGELGGFILDKYFVGHAGINLKDNYPTFRELGSFNIVNPFNTGEYLDKLTQKAFKEGMDGLSVKTYFDHLLMFIAGLKNKGKAGLPFEVTYGTYQEVFGVQIHFFAKNLEIFDVTNSLRSTLSKRAEEYYLNVAVQSSDFFEFSFLPEVDKAIVTALWTKDERIKYENRSFMVSSIKGNQAMVKYLTNDEELSDFADESSLEDFSEKIVPPEDLPEEVKENFIRTFKESDTETIVAETSSVETDNEQAIRLKEIDPIDEETSKVTGSPITKDEISLIKGNSILEELIQKVKGKVEEEKADIRIAGDKIDIEKLTQKITSSYEQTSEQMNLQVRSLGTNFSQAVKTGLYDFSKNLNKPIEELNDLEVDSFHINVLADVIKNELVASIIRDKDNGHELLKEQMGKIELELADAKDKNNTLRGQFAALMAENKSLKERSLKLLRQQVQSHDEKKAIQPLDDADEEVRKHFAKKLSSGKPMDEEDMKKLSSLLEREVKLVTDLRSEEMKSRRLVIESARKEVLLSQEVQNSDKKIHAKDLVLQKTKETLTRMIDKKDHELTELRVKVEHLNHSLTLSSPKSFIQKIGDLEKQNQNLYKQIESYKEKLATLSSTVQVLKADDDSKEEVRKMHMINLQLKNQLSQYQREMEKLKIRTSQEIALTTELRADKIRLEHLLKKQSLEEKKDLTLSHDSGEQGAELKRLTIQNQSLETQLKDYGSKISHLETKLAEAQRPSKMQAGGDESKARVSQLEASLKKLSQDNSDLKNKLDESKKEMNKLRQEKTALQNLNDKLKKDAEKGKPATPKKPGGKAA
jgi:hypothetical protein